MIVLIGGEKGGTGKTTIATNLAAYLAGQSKDVMLLDADKQSSSSHWIERRNASADPLNTVNSVQKVGDVRATAMDLAERCEYVIIDAGGRDSPELRSAMIAADVFYIPIRASQLDLETLPKMLELIRLARINNGNMLVRSILSIAPTNPMIHEVDNAREALGDFESEMPLSRCVIRDRKVYRDAAIEGKGVCEMGNPLAVSEVELLAGEVFG